MDGRRWVPRLQNKDPETYELLFRTWYPEAFRTAYLVTHERSLAEDAVQEAFINVFRSIHSLKQPERLRGWLHAIVSRTAVDVVRRQRSSRTIPVEEIDQAPGDEAYFSGSVNGWPTPEEAALAAQRSDAIMAGLAELTPEFRQVIILFYYHQLSVGEIAEAVGCAEGTVKSRLSRARARLAKLLSPEEA